MVQGLIRSKAFWLSLAWGLLFLVSLSITLPLSPSLGLAYAVFGPTLLTLALFFHFLPRWLKDRPAKESKFQKIAAIRAYFASKENQYRFAFASISVLLFLVFMARFYFYAADYSYVDGLGTSHSLHYYDGFHLHGLLVSLGMADPYLLPYEAKLGVFADDLSRMLTLLAVVTAFYTGDIGKKLRLYFGAPLCVLVLVLFPFQAKGLLSDGGGTYRLYLLGLEMALLSFYYGHALLEVTSFKVSRKEGYQIFAFALPFFFVMCAAYTPTTLFGADVLGLPNPQDPGDLSHRLFLYIAFILPVLYFLLFSPLSERDRRGALLLLSLGSLYGYISIHRGDIWLDLSEWPLHLCNTAMYTMPLTLLWRSYGLYYFTVFINVLGAFLALLMPNYSETLALLSPEIVHFFINHWYAFFMPVLIMLLGVYKRPNVKYFVYSQLGFLAYFVLVMVVNVYLTAHGHNPDFFFINSSFVADKLGKWAQDLFRVTLSFESGGHLYVFHWLYDVLYYLVYILLAAAMWFVYELLFRGVDELIQIRDARQKALNRHARYLLEGGNSMEEKEPLLVISHLSKRYKGAEEYAVKDFSLSLEGGKIYGFLGKNGAGKSTIIKSIVGIHGFDEGEIRVLGHDVLEEPLFTKRAIGFVPDNYALYENLTGRQYIGYIADLYEVPRAEREAVVTDLVKRLELGERFDKPMKTYSHGMKQKITIIAALVHNPKIWILDEPMTGLDPNSIFQIKECMREHAKKGNLVFFSSHIIDVVKNLCDEVIILKHGVLIDRIPLKGNAKARTHLEETFLTLTSDNLEESETLLAEERKEEAL